MEDDKFKVLIEQDISSDHKAGTAEALIEAVQAFTRGRIAIDNAAVKSGMIYPVTSVALVRDNDTGEHFINIGLEI